MLKKQCQTSSGGQGNFGLFIDRQPKIFAAGKTSRHSDKIQDCIKKYGLQDEVEALQRDTIFPQQKTNRLPPLRHPPKLDMRNAGPFSEAAQLLNPPVKTKFQTLVEDFKNTAYNSYWRKEVGTIPDPTPMLPEGYDIYKNALGEKVPLRERLYDVVLPSEPVTDIINATKGPGVQTNRKYCRPAYDHKKTYGKYSNKTSYESGVKRCLTDEKILEGSALRRPLNYIHADFVKANRACLGTYSAPNENIKCVPENFTFGKTEPTSDKTQEWSSMCDINPENELIRKCLGHLNTLRKCLSKRYDSNFFRDINLRLKYLDKTKTGWLPKEVVYNYCRTKLIRFDPYFVEPLLRIWKAFDGENIEYKKFVNIINYQKPSPELPKIQLFSRDCLDFRTTYTDMVSYEHQNTSSMGGVPSGRYIDLDFPVTPAGYCKADRFHLPEESCMKACLNPSVLSHFGISHRDMYTKRDKDVVRKVFEAAGEKFTDENFNEIWNEAKRCHSQGEVCLQSFRNALKNFNCPKIDRTYR
ncbi:EF-hand domain-containing family member B isoform X1 [Bombyx mandarina]|uniref:EF-hand domain-containing family member B isoform X1 n=1 Tax=Bombyx mandarina TaxID=7092 RepID=A0A6J2JIB3_BOMMA|nr:EF-hand domain-containing family member B isoform X1 [Bombyx mandarina]